jgi:hypothetical protein
MEEQCGRWVVNVATTWIADFTAECSAGFSMHGSEIHRDVPVINVMG